MCGIVGIISEQPAAPDLVSGLHRLEYRGYDSAGVATLSQEKLSCVRVSGRIEALEKKLKVQPAQGNIGIGHTRWATHGAPTENNAHPHLAGVGTGGGRLALVHNGIIENWLELKAQLKDATFTSDTDTETMAHLLARALKTAPSEEDALRQVVAQLQGSFACALLLEGGAQKLYGVSRGSPLVVARGQGKIALASDGLAVANWADEIIYMEDGEIAVLTLAGVRLSRFDGTPIERDFEPLNQDDDRVSKEGHRYFMHKEILEQPTAIKAALSHYVQGDQLNFPALPHTGKIENVLMIGCGGSIHAALTARYWLEKIAKLPAHEEIASEFRDRHAVIPQGTLLVFISQSGETADTLAAFRHCKRLGHASVAVVNQAHSTLSRSADLSLPMLAGTEIGVASTKCLTSQMLLLALMTLHIAPLEAAARAQHIQSLQALPDKMREALKLETQFKTIADEVLCQAGYILHLGRGAFYPVALEGALKMKEITYIPSEGYAAGEMKHGPIAMIDERTPIIAIAPSSDLLPKTLSNLQEAKARGGKIILISDKAGIKQAGSLPARTIEMPAVDDFTAPILYTLGVQFLAYYTAIGKGLDPDRPRNLAKSVTVE